jgi:hypothetical protein
MRAFEATAECQHSDSDHSIKSDQHEIPVRQQPASNVAEALYENNGKDRNKEHGNGWPNAAYLDPRYSHSQIQQRRRNESPDQRGTGNHSGGSKKAGEGVIQDIMLTLGAIVVCS